MKLLVNYPSRSRPFKFINIMRSYVEKSSKLHDLHFLIKVDRDDVSMNNPRIVAFLDSLKISYTLEVLSDCKGKIDAINRCVSNQQFDAVICIADDMNVIESNWDDIICQDFGGDYDRCINYNTDKRLTDFKSLLVLPIIGKVLYDRFGYIYHPDYVSEYCDNEQTEVFGALGKIHHKDQKVFDHDWWGNQDSLMDRNKNIGFSIDRITFQKRKANNFELAQKTVSSAVFTKSDKIVQISMIKNEIHIIKHMLPIWRKYADAFVFMDDNSTDGTYEYLIENKEKYNIRAVLRTEQKPNQISFYESISRQQMFDEALKYSNKVICLDADEYLDGEFDKEDLVKLLNDNENTLFYSRWIQYVDANNIRIDGKWRVHWVDRFASYSDRTLYKDKQTHGEHLPVPNNAKYIDFPHIFVSHLAWMSSKKTIAIKQYHYKIWDYVNKLEFGVDIINPVEYDYSVNNFNWEIVPIRFTLQVPSTIYYEKDKKIYESKEYNYIKENISKYNIPNLNDWGMNIH